MRALFITTLNLATNPRLFKEIELAAKSGYEIEVICFEFDNWSYSFNEELKERIKNVKLHTIPAGRKPLLPWILSAGSETFFRFLSKLLPLKGYLLSQAVTRRSRLLVRKIKRLNSAFDLVIGHNPGALYATLIAGRKFHCKIGFDMEDYHPGEGNNERAKMLTKKLLNKVLPQMDYVSFASPLMKKRTVQDIGKEGENWFEVLNYFPKTEFDQNPRVANGILRMVWFSQNVNYKRGLEQVIPVLQKYEGKIELTLIGNKKEKFFQEYVNDSSWIKYLPPMSQKDLHKIIGTFDIGLAIEPGKDHNNIIALANKLITYFQAGLFVLASNTPAHLDFFSLYQDHGMATDLNAENVENAFNALLKQKNLIREKKRMRLERVESCNWEVESEKLVSVWKNINNKY